jgi:hypothetical protein
MLPPCLYNNWIQVTVVEVKDLRQTVAIEIRCRNTNAWMEWIKHSVCTLNKNDFYVYTTGRSESQVVPFSLGQSSDPDEMYCMLAMFQDAKTWDNKSCQMLSLLFPEVRGPMGQHSRTIRPPALDVNYTSCLRGRGMGEGWLTNVGNLMGCSESHSFNSLTYQFTLFVGRANVWWYWGGTSLDTLPGDWAGTCALVQLAIPFI